MHVAPLRRQAWRLYMMIESLYRHNCILEFDKKKVPIIRIDKLLNKDNNVVLFPKKVEKVKEAFEKFGLPDTKKDSR